MQDVFTLGVEEEYLVVDRSTLELRPAAGHVLAAARPTLGSAVQEELTLAQIEVATRVCDSLDDVAGELAMLRSTLSTAAGTVGAAIAASGTHPDADWQRQAITPAVRYIDLAEDYQQLAREQLICGCHVHVAIDDPDELVMVMDRVRPWVPVLLAFAANSPYWQGVDTGYASYRTQVFDRWPTAGPAPHCVDREGYERVVAELVDLGMAADETYLYWHLRPSSRYPTLELRVADVALTADEAATLAALFRSLVRVCHAELGGEPPPEVSNELLRAATWRASRYGLDGTLIDLVRGQEVPARDLVVRLLDHVRLDLEANGEWDVVSQGVARTLRRGNGAERQRDALRSVGSMRSVTEMIVDQTLEVGPIDAAVPTPGAQTSAGSQSAHASGTV